MSGYASVDTMSTDDLEAELSHWEEYYRECERLECGISTKESIRKRVVEAQLFARRIANDA